MYLVITMVDSADIEHFHHPREYYWVAVLQSLTSLVGIQLTCQERYTLHYICFPSFPLSRGQRVIYIERELQ